MTSPVLMTLAEKGFWLPQRVSTSAAPIDNLFTFILWLSVFFTVVITGLGLYFMFKYRQREGHGPEKSPSHNMALELVWSVGPLIIVLYIFYAGWSGYLDLRTPPGDTYDVNVVGQKWNWEFAYPNGYVDPNLHVEVNTPVRLVMSSRDVLHSFYIRDMRVKQDVVPGRYTVAWFEATEPGTYPIYCTEYCGTEHSSMLAEVVVHPKGEFEPWLKEASNFIDKLPPVEAGERLYTTRGCTQCHSLDGKAGIGPSFADIVFGQTRPLADGSTVTYDEEYIRESIMDSRAKIAAGYEPVMPPYRFKDKELDVLIAYIKSLNSNE